MTAVALKQDGSVTIVGERINAQGSRRIKRLLLEENYDEIVLVAREQVEGGAHILDVCTALTERTDEDEQMAIIVKRLAQSVEAPLMIDSTEARVIEKALKIYAGRAVVNSINLENGRTRIDEVMPLVRAAGAAVVALTIDETGMAKTRERKLEVARRIRDIVTTEFDLPPGALIFDALTLRWRPATPSFSIPPLRHRRHPAHQGGAARRADVAWRFEVSLGLKPGARAALNSVMLHHCVEAGLDMALVNAKEITPYGELDAAERELCDDLVFNRRADALQRVIERSETKNTGPAAAAGALDDDSDAPIEKRIH